MGLEWICKLNTDVFFPYYLDLPMEYNPSDHPRASTIFLSKSQTDGEFCSIFCIDNFIISHLLNVFIPWWQMDVMSNNVIKALISACVIFSSFCHFKRVNSGNL